MEDVRQRRRQTRRHALERDGGNRRRRRAQHVEAEAVEGEEEAVRIGPALADDVGDLVLAPDVLGADVAKAAERPGIVDVRPRNVRDLIGRIGDGEQAREIRKRIGIVARQVFVNALQARAADHVVAGIDARRSGNDLRDRGELELVEQIIEERHAAAGRRTVAGPRLDAADIVLSRTVVRARRRSSELAGGVEFRRGWVACRQRGVEPGRRRAVHQPGRAQPL